MLIYFTQKSSQLDSFRLYERVSQTLDLQAPDQIVKFNVGGQVRLLTRGMSDTTDDMVHTAAVSIHRQSLDA